MLNINESAIMPYKNSKSQEGQKICILVQFSSSFLEVTKTADSWRKTVMSAKHKRCVNNWDFVLKDMYSRYKGCVKWILCCGDGVVPSICEQLQTFPSWITYKHIFKSYLGPSLNNICTINILWKSNFWTNLKNLINMTFLCCTPPMERFFGTFLNCQVKFIPWRGHQINKFNAIIPCDNYFVDLKKQTHSVHWGIKPPLKNTTLLFCQAPLPPPLNLQTVQAPLLFRQSPLYIGFSWNPPCKSDFSVNPHNIKIWYP